MKANDLPRYGVDKDALLALDEAGDPADFDAMLRLQAGDFLDGNLEPTAKGRAAAKAIRAHRARRERERRVSLGALDLRHG